MTVLNFPSMLALSMRGFLPQSVQNIRFCPGLCRTSTHEPATQHTVAIVTAEECRGAGARRTGMVFVAAILAVRMTVTLPEDGIVFSTKIHPDEVGRGSSDGQDDVLLRREVKGDPSHGQLAGEQQKLPHR
ncbi:hypothetical protein EYF80_025375 [Liparis tanakae]|uniref:Uncharacterized protein n=1 Tax=Liparis tanakae TaxID=230148 RepID=A0A4Z2HGP8_9TELE|nr:hypothetical protein EYF80_025375 [Liparis tanakae]